MTRLTPEQIDHWLSMAEYELELARGCLERGEHSTCAWHSHQAAEQFLKALHFWEFGMAAPEAVSLHGLLQSLGAPDDLMEIAQDMGADHQQSGGCDGAETISQVGCDEEKAHRRLRAAERVKEFVIGQMARGGRDK